MVIEGGGGFRIEPYGLVKFGYSGVEVAHADVNEPTAVARQRRCGVELDCRIVVGDGAVVVLLVAVGVAAVVERAAAFRIESDRLAVVGDSAGIVLRIE